MTSRAASGFWTSAGVIAALSAAAGLGAASSCSAGGTGSGGSGGGVVVSSGSTGSVEPTGSGGQGGMPPVIHDDFKDPIFDNGAPSTSPAIFGMAGQTSGGPCLFEPELGSLFPRNWLRPRFRFNTANGENLFQIKLLVPNEVSPLVIYTTQSTYTMSAAAWGLITTLAAGTSIHVTVRSATTDPNGVLTAGPFDGTEGDFEIAPVDATGTIVYWTTSNGTVLKGFKVGDETVQSVLTPTQAGTQCVACHTSTPDGKYVATTASDNPGDGSPGFIRIRSVDGNATPAPFVTPAADGLLTRIPQYAPFFSKSHWTTGDHTMLSMIPIAGKTEITWTDLEATNPAQNVGWGILARNGDPNAASSGNFSHDGQTIVYTSSPTSGAGTITNSGGLYTVPYNMHQGGAATPVPGASDASYHYFYPVQSADDQLIAFDRVAAGDTSYNNAAAEVFVIPKQGGTPTRIQANDPPACLGITSPGITNSWGKWSPEVKNANGKSYYFLVFSSTRNVATGGPQLYVAPMVVENGTIKTYSALYLWNQPEMEHNHTPAWDVFDIPPPN